MTPRGMQPNPDLLNDMLSNEQLAKMLASGLYDPNTTIRGRNALHNTITFPVDEFRPRVKMLLEHGVDINSVEHTTPDGNTPLQTLVANESTDNFKYCVQEAERLRINIDYNIQDGQGKTSLILAVKTRNTDLSLFITEKAVNQKDFRVNAQDEDGMTALHYACALGMPSVAEKLLAMGANPKLVNKKNRQAIDCTTYGDDDVEGILKSASISSGRDEYARLNHVSDKNFQPLIAIVNGRLKSHDDVMSVRSSRKRVVSVLKGMIIDSSVLSKIGRGEKKGVNPIVLLTSHALSRAEKDNILMQFDKMSGVSCLRAARRDQLLARDVLIAKGCSYAWLLRSYAANGNDQLDVLLGMPSIGDYLNEQGMPSGNTALHQAAANGHVSACAALVTAGANTNIINTAGNTPMMVACLNKQPDAMLLLAKLGASVSPKNNANINIFGLLADTNQHQHVVTLSNVMVNDSLQVEAEVVAPKSFK